MNLRFAHTTLDRKAGDADLGISDCLSQRGGGVSNINGHTPSYRINAALASAFLSVAPKSGARSFRDVKDTQKPIARWMRDVMAQTGLSATGWAKIAKVGRDTVSRAVRDDYEYVTTTTTLVKLAAAAEVELPVGFTIQAPPGIPSLESLEEVVGIIAEALAPDRIVAESVRKSFALALRDTLAVLATDPDAAADPRQSRLVARALVHRIAH